MGPSERVMESEYDQNMSHTCMKRHKEMLIKDFD